PTVAELRARERVVTGATADWLARPRGADPSRDSPSSGAKGSGGPKRPGTRKYVDLDVVLDQRVDGIGSREVLDHEVVGGIGVSREIYTAIGPDADVEGRLRKMGADRLLQIPDDRRGEIELLRRGAHGAPIRAMTCVTKLRARRTASAAVSGSIRS